MKKRRRYFANEQIREKELRVIGSSGENLGILDLQTALNTARDQGNDLVLVSTKATPPIAKILDFSKFLFQKQRQERKVSKSKSPETKEFRFRPNIDENDLTIRIERAKKFLKENHKILFTVMYMGREISHPEVGKRKFTRILEELKDFAEIEKEPWLDKRRFMLLLKPK